jgi:hypothetical protein
MSSRETHIYSKFVLQSLFIYLNEHRKWNLESTMYVSRSSKLIWSQFQTIFRTYSNELQLKGILSTSCVLFSYPKLLSISVLTSIKWRLNTELLMNTLRNVVFSTKKADHRYRKLINYALTWARPTLFIYLFLCQ